MAFRSLFRARALAVSLLSLSLPVFCASAASANGRYPSAQQLLVDPSTPSRLWLRATYGFLTSADGGATWSWICESAIGYGALEDPPLLVTSDGTALVATSRGLRSSTDEGCSWPLHRDVGDRFSLDLTSSPDATNVFALTNVVQPDTGNFDLVVWRSGDAGGAFTQLGPPIADDLAGQTLDVAPSDPGRLYVTGVVVRTAAPADGGIPAPGEPEGAFLRSRDGGQIWERRRIPSSSNFDWPLIAAVHPTNPDVLYVRVRGRPKARGENIESWLLYSSNAGDTWTEIFRAEADMLGFALGPGGTPIYLGLGDSHDQSLQRGVDPNVLGIHRAPSPNSPFEHVFQGQVGGLTHTGSGLYVLGSNETEGFEIGLSRDRGATVEPVLVLGQAILGPPSCGGDAAPNVCGAEWEQACSSLAACDLPDAGTPRDGGAAPEAGAPPDAGAGTNDAAEPPARVTSGSGCGCMSAGTAGRTPGAGGLASLTSLAVLVRRRWRRRRARGRHRWARSGRAR